MARPYALMARPFALKVRRCAIEPSISQSAVRDPRFCVFFF